MTREEKSQSPFRRGLYSDSRGQYCVRVAIHRSQSPFRRGLYSDSCWHSSCVLLTLSQSPFRRGLYSDSFTSTTRANTSSSQSPFRRGLYSDEGPSCHSALRRPSHNPLFVGASIRTRADARRRHLGLVTIPFSSGPLFGHITQDPAGWHVQSQSPFRRGLYSDHSGRPRGRHPGSHNPLFVGASIRTRWGPTMKG